MKAGLLLFLLIVVAAPVLLVLFVVGVYNSLVRLRNQVGNAWSQVDVQLKRRHDLIPNLVETTRGYMKHERETFEMFGVKFEGHPDLRKLLTLDNWDGPPPMLKDIKFQEMGQR